MENSFIVVTEKMVLNLLTWDYLVEISIMVVKNLSIINLVNENYSYIKNFI